jgi:hypothetical protein
MLVDVHAHHFPLKYAAAALQNVRQLFGPLASQTVEQRLGLMDEAGVDVQVLSPANLVPYFQDETRAAEAAKARACSHLSKGVSRFGYSSSHADGAELKSLCRVLSPYQHEFSTGGHIRYQPTSASAAV